MRAYYLGQTVIYHHHHHAAARDVLLMGAGHETMLIVYCATSTSTSTSTAFTLSTHRLLYGTSTRAARGSGLVWLLYSIVLTRMRTVCVVAVRARRLWSHVIIVLVRVRVPRAYCAGGEVGVLVVAIILVIVIVQYS